MAETIIVRLPLSFRLLVVLACLLMAFSVIRGPRPTVPAIAALCCFLAVAIAIWWREVRITRDEIVVQAFPFFRSVTPIADVMRLDGAKTVILVTARSRISLWGLRNDDAERLFHILPSRIHYDDGLPRAGTRIEVTPERVYRWTAVAGVAFVLSAAAVTPFFAGQPLHAYSESVGKYFLFVCLLCFLAFVFLAGTSWNLWTSRRHLNRRP